MPPDRSSRGWPGDPDDPFMTGAPRPDLRPDKTRFESDDVLVVDYGSQTRKFVAVDALLSDEAIEAACAPLADAWTKGTPPGEVFGDEVRRAIEAALAVASTGEQKAC